MRINNLREILYKNKLDALLIYSSPYDDPAYAKMVLETELPSPLYIVITKKDSYVVCVRWEANDLKFRSKIKKILPAMGQEDKINCITSKLKKCKRLGYLGLVPYEDMIKLPGHKFNLSKKVLEKNMIKKKYEIKFIKKATKILKKALNGLSPKIGMTEIQVADVLKAKGIKDVTVVAGKRLSKTTCAEPTDYRIKKGDIVCVDAQTGYKGYSTDMTRCYVIGKNPYFAYYKILQKVQDRIIAGLREGVISKEILELYRKELKPYKLDKNLEPIDLGHGISFGRHEPPDIGEDNVVLKENMIFTLEPELRFKNFRIRIEDVILLKKKKAVRL